ncbi:RraA family protein [Nocardioides sp.]|uniref:RraA family protein n=1 Tax=Nocardioides sp. TaxID=35761 RepID=UPI003D10A22A
MTDQVNFARLLAAGAATVSDALDKLGIDGACLGIRPVDPGFRLVGRARTVRYAPSGSRKGTVGDYIDDYVEGTVAVLDNAGRKDATVWGDILTEYATAHHLAGTVIDGVCRDSALCAHLGYPIYSRDVYMRTGKDRVQVEELDGPVSIGGIRVEPRDVLVGDRDGVLVIPAGRLEEVCDVADSIAEIEDRIREDVRQGARLAEARAAHGYHALQTRAT